ncbi:unnamed protein product [Albugo candida]|uniref:Uncharacterized protein n=1 Tax=Albugo candida TaxID=65357 RepID=A0A024FTN3_9STRA|nr:unnamed protein product [Albugo candida]|eukprot:CCI10473.1 unnamed protein product [Albugo candida]
MTEALVNVRRPTDRVILLLSAKPYFGLGLILPDRVAIHVHRYWMVCDRIAVSQLKLSKQAKVTFINVYAPQMRRYAEEFDAFYDTLQQTTQRYRHQLFFILREFNAKIGQRCEGETFLGLYSRGYRNDNGIRFRDFCAENDFFLSNTAFYKKRARNITTWQGISGRGPIFNQIDYIILPLRFKAASFQFTILERETC